jgi:tRNA A37 N6-isopentenylltransferase MiaA
VSELTKITEKRLKELERAEAKLYALEAGGVDNWEWYSESLKEWRKENQEEELMDELIENIHQIFAESASVDEPAGRGCGYRIWLEDESTLRAVVKTMVGKFLELDDE